MNQADLKRRIAAERLQPPERVAAIPQIRRNVGGGDRWAFCKTDASTGSSLVCFLDTDTTGAEITVYFTLLGGITNLNEGHLSLVDGTPIRVAKRGIAWYCTTPIEGTEEKDCG